MNRGGHLDLNIQITLGEADTSASLFLFHRLYHRFDKADFFLC